MGIFSNMGSDLETFSEECINNCAEAYFFDEAMNLSLEERARLIQSPEVKALEEKSLIGRNTLVKLNKADDLERRIGMAEIQIGREENSPEYNMLIKSRVMERKALEKLHKKYYTRAVRLSKVAQKSYLASLPAGFMNRK